MFPLFCVENISASLNDFGELGMALGGPHLVGGRKGLKKGGVGAGVLLHQAKGVN